MKKLLCFLGWHEWRYFLQDAIKEFGGLPTDGRVPKSAKCSRCGVNYHKETK